MANLNDVFMSASVGDLDWLKQSARKIRNKFTADKNGFQPIHIACMHGRLDCLRFFLDNCKISPNISSTTGWTPLHLVISTQTGNRSVACLEYLLKTGADVCSVNEDGTTPLHQAATEGHVQCLKRLLAAGADVSVKDVRGNTPLDLAKIWGHRKCARILASENWEVNKHDLAKQMQQVTKLKMQEVLQDIELDMLRMGISLETSTTSNMPSQAVIHLNPSMDRDSSCTPIANKP